MKYLVISFLFLLPTASQAKPKEAKQTKAKQTTKQKPLKRASFFRGSKAKLAPSSLRVSVNGNKKELTKKEDTVSNAQTHKQLIMKTQKRSPHDSALAAMKSKAQELSTKKHGRIRINYAIGLNGKTKNVMVMGYSDKIDAELTKILEGWQMSRRLAGQLVSTRLDIFPANKAAKKATKKKPRKVARK